MKKFSSIALLAGIAALGIVACDEDQGPPPAKVVSVDVSPANFEVGVGATATVSAQVQTEGAGSVNTGVTWSSSNSSVASVSGSGNEATVTGVAEGTATITATSSADASKKASAAVTVTETKPATISIASWRAVDPSGQVVDENNPPLMGTRDDGRTRLVVSFNVEEGDQTVSEVRLLLNGEVADTRGLGSGSDQGVAFDNGVAQVELSVDSDAFDGTPDGNQINGNWPNGDYTVEGELGLANGNTVSTASGPSVTFDNFNLLLVTHIEGTGNTAVEPLSGTRYWGGADVDFAATPIIYDPGVTVGQVTVGSSGGAGPVDIDPNATSTSVTLDEMPFTFTAAKDENEGLEDSPTGSGHDFFPTNVRDDQDEDISSTFFGGSVFNFHLDFGAPTIGTGAEILIDDQSSQMEWYSAGTFSLSGNVTDAGVGFDDTSVEINVRDNGTDMAEDASTVEDDLTESERTLTGYLAMLADRVGNMTDLANDDVTTATTFGVDFTAPTFSDDAPSEDIIFNGNGSTTMNMVLFTTTDPDLADMTSGSGVNLDGVSAKVENLTDGTSATVTRADAEMDNPSNGEFQLNVSTNATGTALGDGDYRVTVTSPDNAIFTENSGEHVFDFILDTKAPTVNIVNPPSANVTSSNASLTFTLEGSSMDANDLASLGLTVTMPGTDDTCGTSDDTDFPEGSAAGEVDVQSVDVDVSAGGTISFDQNFTIQNTGDDSDQTVCWNATAEDNALNNEGDADPNVNVQSVRTEINWQ